MSNLNLLTQPDPSDLVDNLIDAIDTCKYRYIPALGSISYILYRIIEGYAQPESLDMWKLKQSLDDFMSWLDSDLFIVLNQALDLAVDVDLDQSKE